MGMDLMSLKGRRTCGYNLTAWRYLLWTAVEYGWVPEGTVFEESIPATSGDAERNSPGSPGRKLGRGRGGKRAGEEIAVALQSYFSNDGQIVTERDARELLKALVRAINDKKLKDKRCRDDMRDFAAFLKQGSFRID